MYMLCLILKNIYFGYYLFIWMQNETNSKKMQQENLQTK